MRRDTVGKDRKGARRQRSLSPNLVAFNKLDLLGTELLDQAGVHPTGLACLGFDLVPRRSLIGHL